MSEEWNGTTLGEIAHWGAGGTPKAGSPKFYEGGTIPWAVIADVQDAILLGTEKSITEEGLKVIGHQAPAGAVLVTMYGTIGRVAITSEPTATNQAIAWGIPVVELVSSEFLFHWLRNYQPVLDGQARGATQRNINREIIKSTPISLPPLPVQRRIVDLMTHLDAHIANLQAEQGAVVNARNASREALTSGWTFRRLQDVCEISAPLVDPCDNEYAGLLHIGIDKMEKNGGRLSPLLTARGEGIKSAKYLFGPRDVVFSKIRPNLRKVVTTGFTGLCSADAYPLTPRDGIPSSLLREVLLLPNVTEQIVGKSARTKMPKVNRRELMEVEVPICDDEGERREVADTLDALVDVAERVRLEVEKVSVIRQTLLENLLNRSLDIDVAYDNFLTEAA